MAGSLHFHPKSRYYPLLSVLKTIPLPLKVAQAQAQAQAHGVAYFSFNMMFIQDFMAFFKILAEKRKQCYGVSRYCKPIGLTNSNY